MIQLRGCRQMEAVRVVSQTRTNFQPTAHCLHLLDNQRLHLLRCRGFETLFPCHNDKRGIINHIFAHNIISTLPKMSIMVNMLLVWMTNSYSTYILLAEVTLMIQTSQIFGTTTTQQFVNMKGLRMLSRKINSGIIEITEEVVKVD